MRGEVHPAPCAAVELRGVRKSFGRTRVLRGVDLTVHRGEIVGLLGPNGSGKTTTLRLIAGFLAADSGMVRVCGAETGPYSRDARAHTGYLPERPPVYDDLTVTAYLDFVSAAKGLTRGERRRAVAAALADYELEAVRQRVIGRLSKGFRQRVGLAQATLGRPEVLLLDEATSGLDPVQIIEARKHIERDSAGRAVIFSTHVMQEAAALCSRVVVMHRGQVLAVERPANDADTRQHFEVALEGLDEAAAVAMVATVPGVLTVESLTCDRVGEVRLQVAAVRDQQVRDRVARAVLDNARLHELAIRRPSLEERFVRSIAAAHAAAEDS